MENPFDRLKLITGFEAAAAIERSHVFVVGVGGVGSWCAEALVRSGIGSITIIDPDIVCASNINRQVQALSSSIGRLKTDALRERLLDINPSCRVLSFSSAFSKETSDTFNISGADYIIDAIDTLSQKLDLIETVFSGGKPLFSSMGMAQKLDPTLIRTADIWDTEGCPLAALVRQGLRKRNFNGHFTAVYSPEKIPLTLRPCENPFQDTSRGWESGKKQINGSAVMVTAAAGMILASLVIKDICATFGGQHCE